jgi:hypothetical protein
MGCQPLVGHAEAFAVAAFEVDVLAQVSVDARDVQRVDRQPPLVLLARPCHHSRLSRSPGHSLGPESLCHTAVTARCPGRADAGYPELLRTGC